jgi:hypothetical protein
MGTKAYDNALDLLTFSRASGGTSLRKISYGSELVTNGTFDTDTTGWSVAAGNGTIVSSGGEVLGTCGTLGLLFSSSITTVVGKVYRLSVDGRRGTFTDILQVGLGATPTVTPSPRVEFTNSSPNQTKEITFVATSTTTYINVRLAAVQSGATVYLDNVSVKEFLFDQPDGTLTLFNHPNNIPRIDYNADGTVEGLLIEEQRTNLVTYSEQFDNAAWVKSNATVTSNAAVSPDGNSAADKLVENSATSGHYVWQSYTHSGQAMTLTMYAKAGERSLVRLKYNDASNHRYGAVFDLSDGTVVNDANTISGVLLSSSIEPVGEFYRIRISGSAPAGSGIFSASLATVKTSTTNSNESYTGDGTSGIYIWGAQLEAGSFPTSYIPTSGATATRSADIASIPVTDFGYNQKAGTVVVEYTTVEKASGNSAALTGRTAAFGTVVGPNINDYFGGGIWRRNILYSDSGVTQANFNPAQAPVNPVALSWKENSIQACYAGTLQTEDTVATIDANSSYEWAIGVNINNSPMTGHIKSIQYYPRRLTNTQLQELTS